MENKQHTFSLRNFSARFVGALRKLGRDRRGAELVEVLVVTAVVALGGIVAMQTIRDQTNAKATYVGEQLVERIVP